MDSEETNEMLVTRRPKRSTAGNRMEAALAEMALEDSSKEVDDDNDFVNDKVEEDVFGSDFESTDEEAEKQVEETAEKEIVHEERTVRKVARTRLERATAAAHAKHRSTFNPDIQLSVENDKPKLKVKPFVTLGLSVEGVKWASKKSLSGKKRMSQRKHTIQNTSATVKRQKQTEAKKASQPKKAKVEYRRYTQGELIALALDTEEGNIVEHRDYLKNESEKRKRARVVRTVVEGPLLRWISKTAEVKVPIPPPPPPTAPVPPYSTAPTMSIHRSIYGPPGSLFTPTTYSYSAGGSSVVSTIASTPTPQSQPILAQPSVSTFSPYQFYMDPTLSAFPMWPPPPQPPTSMHQHQSYYSSSLTALANPVSVMQQQQQNTTAPQVAPEPEFRNETVSQNYVIHELAQHNGVQKPSWGETMKAMFGDDVNWEGLKVFAGKNRPLSRPRQICPITGRQAHYLDPRTGVPYSDSHAYKVLTDLLGHKYIWSATLGCYLDRQDPPPTEVKNAAAHVESVGEKDDAMSVFNDT